MWHGIHADNGGHLTMSDSEVKDAQYAVKVNGTPANVNEPISNISLSGNTFDLNFISVYVPRSGV